MLHKEDHNTSQEWGPRTKQHVRSNEPGKPNTALSPFTWQSTVDYTAPQQSAQAGASGVRGPVGHLPGNASDRVSR